MFGDNYRVWSHKSCYFLKPSAYSFLIDPNVNLRSPFLNTVKYVLRFNWRNITSTQNKSRQLHLKRPLFCCVDAITLLISTVNVKYMVHSCQQKSIGLKFSKSQTGSDVRYSCHHNSSHFTFLIFAHSCRFSVLHSL